MNITYKICPALFAIALLAGCSGLAGEIGHAHGMRQWHRQRAVCADIVVELGGKKMIDAAFVFDTPVGKAKAELANGTTIVFDGRSAWVSPANAPIEAARFHLLTWPYFMTAPMKLGDPGSKLVMLEDGDLFGLTCQRAKLTFQAGVGDAPDDWYILYIDPTTHRLRAMSYIVTYFESTEKAEKEPHAIVYDDFTTIQGVVFSRKWTFYHYSEEKGIHGKPMGKARITNIRFVTPAANAFAKPDNAREDKLPPR